MIEAFNGWFLFILYLLNLAGGGFYAYQSVLNTENFMEKYGIHRSALLPARLAGSFVLTTFLMGLYIIYRGGPEGTWVFFNILFIQSLIFFQFDLFSKTKLLITPMANIGLAQGLGLS